MMIAALISVLAGPMNQRLPSTQDNKRYRGVRVSHEELKGLQARSRGAAGIPVAFVDSPGATGARPAPVPRGVSRPAGTFSYIEVPMPAPHSFAVNLNFVQQANHFCKKETRESVFVLSLVGLWCSLFGWLAALRAWAVCF